MKYQSPRTLALAALILFASSACGDDPKKPTTPTGGGHGVPPPPTATVTHPASAPLAAITGDVAFVSLTRAIGVTDRGIQAFATAGSDLGKPLVGYAPWALTSTGSGPAASALALVPDGKLGSDPWAMFLPTGRPQAGALQVSTSQGMGALAGEAVLGTDLVSTFPSALSLPSSGPASSAAWIVDAVFGPGSVVRAYEWSSFDAATKQLAEKPGRRFTPNDEDFDGDGTNDATSLGKLVFADSGRVGLVSFSFLAPAPAGAAGGVYAFDPETGDQLGHLVLPLTSTVTGALEFVGSVRTTEDQIIVISAVKSAMYEDLGGRVAVYHVRSWTPFEVDDADASAKYDQPATLLATSRPNPIGLEVVGTNGYVLDAPFFAEGALDVLDLRGTPKIAESVAVGNLYVAGFGVPGDPRVSPDERQILIGSEAGLVRVELTPVVR